MVGPVVKIDPATLPQDPNIHYLGQRPYAELPAYLSGWDVCLLPFARNRSTQFISPTKTLEYMAAEKMHRQHADHGRGRAVRRTSSIWATRRRNSLPPARVL